MTEPVELITMATAKGPTNLRVRHLSFPNSFSGVKWPVQVPKPHCSLQVQAKISLTIMRACGKNSFYYSALLAFHRFLQFYFKSRDIDMEVSSRGALVQSD